MLLYLTNLIIPTTEQHIEKGSQLSTYRYKIMCLWITTIVTQKQNRTLMV